MYPGLKAALDASRAMSEVDIMKDASIFDVGAVLSAVHGNSPKEALVTVFPNVYRPKFGLRQPRIKAPGKKVTCVAFAPFDPTLLAVGTQDGPVSLWRLPENGLKGDISKPAAMFDCKEEVKAIDFHPLAKDLFAVGLRNGHVLVFDTVMEQPRADLVHTRPINSIAWSDDGSLLFVLYVDMVIKVWDVRANECKVEKKICPTRGLGFLEALPGNKVLASIVQGKNQELTVFDSALEILVQKQFEQKPMPLSVKYNFTNMIVAHANRESKLYILNPEDLTEISTYTHSNPILGALPELNKPDPDSSNVITVTIFNTNQTIDRVLFSTPQPPRFPPYPIMETEFTAAAYFGGETASIKTEDLAPTIVEEAEEEVVDTTEKIVTKFRFLMAEADPPRDYYINLPVGNTANPEFNEVCTNGTQFAFIGHGSPNPIYVVPLGSPMKMPAVYPHIMDAHKSLTSYLTFSPHNPDVLLSSGEDGKIRLWKVPQVLTENITESLTTFNCSRRVGVAKFSQSVRNLIASASAVPELTLWDINAEKKIVSLDSYCHTSIQDIEFDSLSTQLRAVFSDGTVKIFDPRTAADAVLQTKAHTGGKHRRILDLPDFGQFATFGGSKGGDRQVSIWDARNVENSLKTIDLDHSFGAFIPMYEEGSGVIYVGGKGDGHVRFLELCNDDRVVASMGIYETSEPERGLCLLPKSSLNVMKVEVSKMVKLGLESMRLLHWRVPRRQTEYFQDDAYGVARDTRQPLMEVVDWQAGHTDTFPTWDLQPPGSKKQSEAPKYMTKSKYSFEQETLAPVETEFTIDTVVAYAPKISSSDEDDEPSEQSDSW